MNVGVIWDCEVCLRPVSAPSITKTQEHLKLTNKKKQPNQVKAIFLGNTALKPCGSDVWES